MVRDDVGRIVGFSTMAELERLPNGLLDVDPVARRWSDHLGSIRSRRARRVWPTASNEPIPGNPMADAIHAACFLDLLRNTMELRPELRRRYQVSQKVFDADDVETTLGLERIPAHRSPSRTAGRATSTASTLAPGSVDGWLTRLVATELQVDQDTVLDAAQHQLVVGGRPSTSPGSSSRCSPICTIDRVSSSSART